MAKLTHINIHNLAHLSGLNDQRAVHMARVLDSTIEAMMYMATPQAERFREWRRRATFTDIQPTNHSISFRVYQIVRSDGKLLTIISVDGSQTDGTFGRPRRGAHVYCYMGADEGQEVVSVPLVYLLREHGSVANHHVLYEHGSVDYSVTAEDVVKNLANEKAPKVPMPAAPHGSNGLVYVGITSRAWTRRYREHLQDAANGSRLPFHRALRERFATCNTRFHYVLMLFPTKELAEDAEEEMVERRSLYPKGLNAIPGGQAGLRYLASINAQKARESVPTEDLESMLAKFLREHPEAREGNPSLARLWGDEPTQSRRGVEGLRPEMARFWSDDTNAARLTTSRADRLSIEQIRNARYSGAMGLTAAEIAKQIGARNVEIVARLLDGKTYRRVM